MPGQTKAIKEGNDVEECKHEFTKKFFEKTKNSWESRGNFKKVPNQYDLVQIDYECSPEEAQELESALSAAASIQPKKNPSKLHPKVQSLVELVFDLKEMTAAMVEMKYDVKKMPLGKLTQAQIKAGYDALTRIEEAIRANRSTLEATNDFYTRIPHTFGMKTPPVIRTMEIVKEKTQLLEVRSVTVAGCVEKIC